MKRESKTLFALFVLAIVLLVWRACAPRVTPTSSVEAEASGAAAVASAVESDDVGSSNTSAEVMTKAATVPTPASGPKSLVPPIRAQRLDDYADSRDLLQFIDNLRAAADAGDGEAAGFVARAYDECFLVIIGARTGRQMYVDPSTLAEPQRSVAAAQLAISKQRCDGLIAQSKQHDTGWAMERIKTYMAKAKTGGDLGQLVNNSDVNTLEVSSADDNELLRRIAGSGDDQAVLILALSVVDASGERDIQGPFSGSPIDMTAWMLVSCDLGRDCEPNGRLVREKCLTLGQCLGGSYRDYIRYYVSTPYQFEEALKKERRILDLLARGALDELFPLRSKRD